MDLFFIMDDVLESREYNIIIKISESFMLDLAIFFWSVCPAHSASLRPFYTLQLLPPNSADQNRHAPLVYVGPESLPQESEIGT